MTKKNPGKHVNIGLKKARYNTVTMGEFEVVTVGLKYRASQDFRNVGKISKSIAELKAAGYDIEQMNTAHANALFLRSFFWTTIVATKRIDPSASANA